MGVVPISDESGFDIRPHIFRRIAQEVVEAYLEDRRPWVVGYSGGKDSTALLQIVYHSLAALPRDQLHKPVYVLGCDTRVEAPRISARLRNELETIGSSATREGLPISAHLVYPNLNDTFWVNLIGRGYPSPTRHFRWCTDRLKIRPVSQFIQGVVNRSGAVVVVLGARSAESATRAQAMQRRAIAGSRFRPHVALPKAWVYTPIEDLTTNEVWTYLLSVPSPWNGDNRELVALYKQAAGGECPLAVDTSTPSCGQSRFGCWTCTVVGLDHA